MRRQQQHARYDQCHDRCVVLCAISAVDNAEALHEDHGKDKVCATLLFECDARSARGRPLRRCATRGPRQTPTRLCGPSRVRAAAVLAILCHNHTGTEFVNFIDNDTLFITPVTRGDLFDEQLHPRIIGQVGRPADEVYWSAVPAITQSKNKTGHLLPLLTAHRNIRCKEPPRWFTDPHLPRKWRGRGERVKTLSLQEDSGQVKCTSRRNFAPFSSSILKDIQASARAGGTAGHGLLSCYPAHGASGSAASAYCARAWAPLRRGLSRALCRAAVVQLLRRDAHVRLDFPPRQVLLALPAERPLLAPFAGSWSSHGLFVSDSSHDAATRRVPAHVGQEGNYLFGAAVSRWEDARFASVGAVEVTVCAQRQVLWGFCSVVSWLYLAARAGEGEDDGEDWAGGVNSSWIAACEVVAGGEEGESRRLQSQQRVHELLREGGGRGDDCVAGWFRRAQGS